MSTATLGRSLWFAIVAPAAAWVVQEWLGWFFGARTCGEMTPLSVRWVVFGISIAMLLVALAAMSLGWRTWRSVSSAAAPTRTDAQDRVEFMALGGFLVSTVFAIAIIWGGLSSAFLFDCGRIR